MNTNNFWSAYVIKPDRALYYMNTTKEEIDDFYNGIIPERLMKYNGAFGSYDCPGLFILDLNGVKLKVLGIEFRPDDDRIDYPTEFEHVFLPRGVLTTDTFWDEEDINEDWVMDFLRDETPRIPPNPFFDGKIISKTEMDVVSIYIYKDYLRIYINADYDLESLRHDELCDKTETEKRFYEKIYHDAVTGHYNWNYMWQILSGHLTYGISDYAFVHFDVKDFKAINVVYGHMIANFHLNRIVDHMKEQDWIYFSARCDNDNFAMMIKDMPEEEMKEKLSNFFEEISYLEEDKSFRINYRCGVVPMRTTMDLGNRVADAAKQAQSFGTKMYETEIIFFTEKMKEEREWSIRIRTYLDTAIENDEFLVYLQPKLDIQNEKIHGAEALIRWNYRGKKVIGPGKFVPLFETGGLISKLDDIVLDKVCATLEKWKEEGRELYPISVNISRKSMGIAGLVERLTAIVDKHGVEHGLIDFEITESAAYDNQDNMIRLIVELKKKGFNISIDDFGTGYSSLAMLSKMPVDTIKIDKSFVDGIGSSDECQKSCAVIKSAIHMTQELNLTCLVEGAEEREQIELLKDFGCEVVQGYYFSRPIPMGDFEEKYL